MDESLYTLLGGVGSTGVSGLGRYGLGNGALAGLLSGINADIPKTSLFKDKGGLSDKDVDDDMLKKIFGDKGMLQGITSSVGGLANVYMGLSALSNAKKQQKFTNNATRYQLDASTKMVNDKIDQRSQSHAASKGLSGAERDAYVAEQNKKSQLSKFNG